MAVFVLDKHKKPLMPCSEKRARLLLERGRAVVHKIEPFTIRIKDRRIEESEVQPLRLKLDPGSKQTGVAVLREDVAVYLGELHHKQGITKALKSRRSLRRARRNRKTRYRAKRFNNRKRPKGWLAPSLQARVEQTANFVRKMRKLLPINAISQELVRFDLQKMQNPTIDGIEYQQGTLYGYEVREYLLEKFEHKCVYCEIENVPFEVEHFVPRSRGGSDRISNLALACHDCNQDKDNLLPEEWLFHCQKRKTKKDAVRIKNIPVVAKQIKQPLRDAAAVNSTRFALLNTLRSTGLSVETGSGGMTKWQRTQHGLPKTHYFDALCVGVSTPTSLRIATQYVQIFQACGRGNRQMARVDKFGFPKGHRKRKKTCCGFQTGDLVIAQVTKGKKIGFYKGRVSIRHNNSFNIKCLDGTIVEGVGYQYCHIVQRSNGWSYSKIAI